MRDITLDGSFVTEKIDPWDSDVVVIADATAITTRQQQDVLNWIEGNLKNSHMCDSYVGLIYPVGHVNYNRGAQLKDYWERHFGTARDGTTKKGIVVIET